jgi:hypothetical protein
MTDKPRVPAVALVGVVASLVLTTLPSAADTQRHDDRWTAAWTASMIAASPPLPAFYTEPGEAVREAVNDWIRYSGAFDTVVDLDRLFADPADPQRMRTEYSSGDGVYPNDAGMRAIAGAIDLGTV